MAKKNNCSLIIQCGDFGFWEHQRDGDKFLHKVSRHLGGNGMQLWFVDGNHDNHPKLWDYPAGEDGLVEVRRNIFYVPRGTVFKLGDVTCMGLGGAFSIDKDWRLEREAQYGRKEVLYWPTEMIRPEDVNTGIVNASKFGPIDIMFTHDCPTGINVPGIHAMDKWQFKETWENRDRLREVFDVALPRLLVHGHYHVRYTGGIHWQPGPGEPLDGCRVEGLEKNGRDGFAIVLDLEAMFGSQ